MHTRYIRTNRIFLSALLTLAVMTMLVFTLSLAVDGIGFTESVFGYGSGYSSGSSGGGVTSSSDNGVEEESPVLTAEVVSKDITGKIDADGVMTQSVMVASSNGNAAVEVPAGTTARDVDGNALTEITYQEATPAPVSPGRNMVVVADFGPDGATFNPPVTVTMTYDLAALPEGVAAEDLVLAYYDTVTGDWVELSAVVVDTVNHTVSGAASHFTQFAVLAESEIVTDLTPAAPVYVSPVVEPTSPEVVSTTTPESTLVLDLAPDASPDGDEFRPLTSKSDNDSGDGISYWLIIIPVIAVLSISLAVFYTVKRQRA